MLQRSFPSPFESQYQRVLETAECRTQAELARFLEIRQSSIADARRRQSIPTKWHMTLLEKKGINPFWILSGEGARCLVPADAGQGKPQVLCVMEIRPPQKCSCQELFNELVRRSLRDPDGETIQEEVAGTWMRMKKTRPRWGTRRR